MIQADALDEIMRRYAKLLHEQSGHAAFAHSGDGRQAISRKGLAEVFHDIGLNLPQWRCRIAWRKQERAELGLSALTLRRDHKAFGAGKGDMLPMILADKRKREINPRRHAGRGHQSAIAGENTVMFDTGGGKFLGQSGGILPMRGHQPAIEQTGMAQGKGAGADRAVPLCLYSPLSEPSRHGRVFVPFGKVRSASDKHGMKNL